MSNYTTKHLATKSHVDVASAIRASGRVGDEAASFVVGVHFRWRLNLNELEEDVAHIRDATHSFVEGDDLGLSSRLRDEFLTLTSPVHRSSVDVDHEASGGLHGVWASTPVRVGVGGDFDETEMGRETQAEGRWYP